jgi:hypothetical protein
MPKKPDPARLASDGTDVLEGVEPPTADELAAVADLTPVELRDHIDAHIAEVDRGDG